MPTSLIHPTHPLHSPVRAWMQRFSQGTADPVAACEHYLARIAQHNPALNAYLWVDAPRSLAMARDSQQRWAQGRPLSPWDGLPIAIKDNLDVQGWPCSAGAAADRHRRPPTDAAVVQQLRALGMVVLGKLNMHEGALGATNANPTYGDCQNPWRVGFTPGGSSGGSAAAVRAQLCAAAIGTDTMGSVRVPASYCGVTAYKPSAGLVSNGGGGAAVPHARHRGLVDCLCGRRPGLGQQLVAQRAGFAHRPRSFTFALTCYRHRNCNCNCT